MAICLKKKYYLPENFRMFLGVFRDVWLIQFAPQSLISIPTPIFLKKMAVSEPPVGLDDSKNEFFCDFFRFFAIFCTNFFFSGGAAARPGGATARPGGAAARAMQPPGRGSRPRGAAAPPPQI